MGGGAVSMSFGAAEGNWTASVDPAFAATGMTYLAATGDSGSAVSWPSVSTKVVAVGGTTLRYTTGTRSETSWSRTGGGISAYTATPAYQSNQVPGVGTLAHRAVADVAFNADPSTGQFVAVMTPGSSAVSWVSAGGTSLSTPQWAGLVAVANAMRVRAAKPLLGAPHGALYGQIAAVPGNYAAAFSDVLSGTNGTCATCAAKIGYDVPTGLGTPNVAALLSALGGAAAAPTAPVAPVVAAATVNGKTGLPLSYGVTVTAATATGFSLANAPTGMGISNTGVVSWANPVAGTYAVTVTALNAASGLSGKGVLTVVIVKSAAPVITAPALVGVAGRPLSGSITVTAPAGAALTVTISGVPAGVSFLVRGQALVLYWARPVTGKFTLSISARDSSGATTQASLPITIKPS
jgi:subtilase family serine protease